MLIMPVDMDHIIAVVMLPLSLPLLFYTAQGLFSTVLTPPADRYLEVLNSFRATNDCQPLERASSWWLPCCK